MYDTDEIKARNSIVDVIGKVVLLKKSGANHQGLCPFHSEKSPSFTVNESKQFYYCFGCGAGGNVIDFVMEYNGVEFKEACEMLGGSNELYFKQQEDRKLIMPQFREPKDHRQDYEKAKAFIESNRKDGGYYLKGDRKYRAMYNGFYKPVNVMRYDNKFLAGGMSYGAGFIVGNGIYKHLCLSFESAFEIAKNPNAQAIVVLNEYNMRICAIDCGQQPLFLAAMVCSDGLDKGLIEDLQEEKRIVI